MEKIRYCSECNQLIAPEVHKRSLTCSVGCKEKYDKKYAKKYDSKRKRSRLNKAQSKRDALKMSEGRLPSYSCDQGHITKLDFDPRRWQHTKLIMGYECPTCKQLKST